LLILGASGVAKAIGHVCKKRGLAHASLTNAEWIRLSAAKIASRSPWAVVNASVDAYPLSTADAERVTDLASLCSRFEWPLLVFSSDRVFNGLAQRPYDEHDDTNSQDEFGSALASVEKQLLQIHPNTLIARSGPILDPADPYCFGVRILSNLMSGHPSAPLADVSISPAYIQDLINGALDLLIDGERGIWHLANRGHMTLTELANRLGKEAGLGAQRARVNSEHRPRSFALISRRGWVTPTIESAISRFYRACTLREIARDALAEIPNALMSRFDYLSAG
jgi:dTDP-4-dehydrorhamnose reductase